MQNFYLAVMAICYALFLCGIYHHTESINMVIIVGFIWIVISMALYKVFYKLMSQK